MKQNVLFNYVFQKFIQFIYSFGSFKNKNKNKNIF